MTHFYCMRDPNRSPGRLLHSLGELVFTVGLFPAVICISVHSSSTLSYALIPTATGNALGSVNLPSALLDWLTIYGDRVSCRGAATIAGPKIRLMCKHRLQAKHNPGSGAHSRYWVGLGRIRSSPSCTAFAAAAPNSLQATHHCGLMTGSITSPLRLHFPSLILLPSVPRNSPRLLSQSTMSILACKSLAYDLSYLSALEACQMTV